MSHLLAGSREGLREPEPEEGEGGEGKKEEGKKEEGETAPKPKCMSIRRVCVYLAQCCQFMVGNS